VGKLEFLSVQPWCAAGCRGPAVVLPGRSAARVLCIYASRPATMPSRRRAARRRQLRRRDRDARDPTGFPIIASDRPAGCSAAPVMAAPRGAVPERAGDHDEPQSGASALGPRRFHEIPGALSCPLHGSLGYRGFHNTYQDLSAMYQALPRSVVASKESSPIQQPAGKS
jgi:hypothetical protein